ncbi:hypothetical protein [Halococcus salsus]|uniref:hypothetical protein n=1 Tax=Halococcus salsus TaxID=2162894 RepID=UPI00135720AE|nr:hypothetical protein [Halococcus salsus]
MTSTLRPRLLVLVVVVALVGSGCVTAQPTITVESNSPAVFEGFSTSDAWGASSIQASVSLTPQATTSLGVTELSVVTESGKSFYTTTVDAGQTSVTLPLPVGTTATVVAVNTVNGTTVGTANVTTSGNTLP